MNSPTQSYWSSYNNHGQAVVYDFPAPAEHTQRHLDMATIAAESSHLRAENTRLRGEVKDNAGWAFLGKALLTIAVCSAIGYFTVKTKGWFLVWISTAAIVLLKLDKWMKARQGA